ncbi:FHA domain protein [Thalassoglobus neptunius]|uniref:FHA domain protein n=1 Tax=Thalassoglobus neptunius TaxID=1938619 RepID=A0A5C5VQH3_9PLAN|nr:FHA domain-containing protein [Thalassoglobus neptunius]TWT40051.1 FHA domain protein [Thalassoglobus neptunius]
MNTDSQDEEMMVQTTLEPLQQILKDAAGVNSQQKVQPTETTAKQKTHLFRPINRQPVAKLIVLDDGSRDVGEEIRIRQAGFTIGREKGDLKLPFDRDISSQHAELRCHQQDGKFRWYLIDNQSKNGTFLRAYRASLSRDSELIMGSRRYVFKLPNRPSDAESEEIQETNAYRAPSSQHLDQLHPRLVEMGVGEEEIRTFVIKQNANRIGRSSKCSIQVDEDSFLSPQHAKLQKNERGRWMIADMKSANGIWIRIRRMPIDRQAEFQIGLQRFIFQPQLTQD